MLVLLNMKSKLRCCCAFGKFSSNEQRQGQTYQIWCIAMRLLCLQGVYDACLQFPVELQLLKKDHDSGK